MQPKTRCKSNMIDLHYMADDTRIAGKNMLQSWTLYGHHKDTNTFTKLSGWTTWDVSKGGKIQTAQMCFDASQLLGSEKEPAVGVKM